MEVLDLRESIYVTIKECQTRIDAAFKKLEATTRIMADIKKHKADIDAGKDYKYTEEERYITKQPLDATYQMCEACQVTCCQVCKWPANALESQCTFFAGDRGCPKCPGQCPRSKHVRATELIVWKTRTVEKEWSQKKAALRAGEAGLSNSERLLAQKRREMENDAKLMLKDMQTVKESLATLDDIALKPRTFTNADYFKQMIKNEEESRQPGYESRLEGLKILLARAEKIQQLDRATKVEDLFPQYKEVLDEAAMSSSSSRCCVM